MRLQNDDDEIPKKYQIDTDAEESDTTASHHLQDSSSSSTTTTAANAFSSLTFPTQVITKKGDLVRNTSGQPIQFHVVGTVKHCHLGEYGTLGSFDVHNVTDAKKQLTVQGPEVLAFHSRLKELIPSYTAD